MKQFFVIGNKASKSLSPLIFNHWFKKYKINAKYYFVETTKNNFDKTVIKKIKDKRTCGFNVTIPFKTNILKHLDALSHDSKKIGAVNCVVVGKRIKGTNTDGIGYLKCVEKQKITKNKQILILGYGGASQAIFYSLITKGYKNITVFNRSKKLIKINNFNKYTKEYLSIENYLEDADLIIKTTPTNPLSKKQINLIKKKTIISDIVYKPKNTPFMKKFKANKKIFGISMLIEQAAPCFNHWFGFVPQVDKALLKKIDRKIT